MMKFCAVCGNPFSRPPSNFKRTCSPACKILWRVAISKERAAKKRAIDREDDISKMTDVDRHPRKNNKMKLIGIVARLVKRMQKQKY